MPEPRGNDGGGGSSVQAITPAGARLSVTDPPIPEDDGLWVPPSVQGLAGDLEVAVVVETGAGCDLPLEAGDRVFFHQGHFAKIGDVKIIGEDCVLAYEKR